MGFEVIPPREYIGQCDTHGEFSGTVSVIVGREFKSGCPKCQKEREEQKAKEDQEKQAMIDRMEISMKLQRAAIPARFADKTFECFSAETERQRKALDACQGYAEAFPEHFAEGRCLMLMGKPGCGKTHLGAAIALYLCKQTKYTAVYRTLPGLIGEIRSTYGSNEEYSEAEIMRAITRCSLLVLDEIGATKTSEFEMALLFNVINARYEDKRPTVIISNLPPAELKTAIGDRCVDRLREGGGIVVGFDWESKRGAL